MSEAQLFNVLMELDSLGVMKEFYPQESEISTYFSGGEQLLLNKYVFYDNTFFHLDFKKAHTLRKYNSISPLLYSVNIIDHNKNDLFTVHFESTASLASPYSTQLSDYKLKLFVGDKEITTDTKQHLSSLLDSIDFNSILSVLTSRCEDIKIEIEESKIRKEQSALDKIKEHRTILKSTVDKINNLYSNHTPKKYNILDTFMNFKKSFEVSNDSHLYSNKIDETSKIVSSIYKSQKWEDISFQDISPFNIDIKLSSFSLRRLNDFYEIHFSDTENNHLFKITGSLIHLNQNYSSLQINNESYFEDEEKNNIYKVAKLDLILEKINEKLLVVQKKSDNEPLFLNALENIKKLKEKNNTPISSSNLKVK